MSPGLRKLGSILALAATGCSASVSPQMPAATVTLRPYLAPTTTSTATVAFRAPTPEATARPTPTPFTHTIQKDETLLLIAARYGISLEELLAANPGINPRFLSIGQQLTIPGPAGGPLIPDLPTTTPVPVQLSGVKCYATVSRGLTCLASVTNAGTEPAEGVVVAFTLFGRDGEVLSTEQAYTPLNLLTAGGMLPVSASFAVPSVGYTARAVLLGAIPAAQPGERYASLDVSQGPSQRSDDGNSWTVSGEVEVNAPSSGEIRRLVILAMGMDTSGEIVGFVETELQAASPAVPIAYKLYLFSLGPPIESVIVVAEASVSE